MSLEDLTDRQLLDELRERAWEARSRAEAYIDDAEESSSAYVKALKFYEQAMDAALPSARNGSGTLLNLKYKLEDAPKRVAVADAFDDFLAEHPELDSDSSRRREIPEQHRQRSEDGRQPVAYSTRPRSARRSPRRSRTRAGTAT